MNVSARECKNSVVDRAKVVGSRTFHVQRTPTSRWKGLPPISFVWTTQTLSDDLSYFLCLFSYMKSFFRKNTSSRFFTLCGVATSPRTFTLSISFHKKTREPLFCQDFPRFLFILSFSILAEREGFEPSRRSLSRLLALQASAFDHSATSPHTVLNLDDRSILDKAGGESGI